MAKPQELMPHQLRRVCDPAQLPFSTTQELEPLEGVMGQERAVEALNLGLRVNRRGYNVFLTGLAGSGKTSYALAVVREIAAQQPVPPDWCYVHNFQDASQPRAVELPPGRGRLLVKDATAMLEDIEENINAAFGGEEFQNRKAELVRQFQNESQKLVEEMNEYAEGRGFTLKRTSGGFVTVPRVDGKLLEEQEDYDQLDPGIKEQLEEKSSEVQTKAREIMRRIEAAEASIKKLVVQLEQEIGLRAVEPVISALKVKYQDCLQLGDYWDLVQEDVLANLELFRHDKKEENAQLPWFWRLHQNARQRYQVNLFVDNSQHQGAPVLLESNPSYYNLVGRIEHEQELGMVTTDFTMLRAGALQRANGGYLIIHAKEVLAKPEAWQALKRVLLTGEVRLENMGEHYGLIAMAASRPKSIPVGIKIVMIGTPYLYHLLRHYDEDFEKLFKIKADFVMEMPRTPANEELLGRFVGSLCQKEGMRPFQASGVAQLVEYASSLADSQEKLSTHLNKMVELIFEAEAWAAQADSPAVEGQHVRRAELERRRRYDWPEEKMREMFAREKILLDTHGGVVGQVNGLSVLFTGDHVFGRPSRITANTFLGERGVVHIERETRMSGSSHTKGVLILSGYLGEKYGQKEPLSLSASLCFEQVYGEVDGDSASSAELYALLSSLSNLPLNQELAVTGSVNQRGQIQPVGGVNAKIEGFFRVCQQQGLTGGQGVLIPRQNVADLMLDPEVIEAVRAGNFHIYPVATVDEGIELLTGVKAGEPTAQGNFSRGSVNYRVAQRLRQNRRNLTRKPGRDRKDKADRENRNDHQSDGRQEE